MNESAHEGDTAPPDALLYHALRGQCNQSQLAQDCEKCLVGWFGRDAVTRQATTNTRRMLPAMGHDRAGIDDWRQRRFSCRDDVVVTDLGDQLVLLDPRTQEMFALDAAGRFIWQGLANTSLGHVADALAAHYGIGQATAATDVLDLVTELGDADLLHAVSRNAPSE